MDGLSERVGEVGRIAGSLAPLDPSERLAVAYAWLGFTLHVLNTTARGLSPEAEQLCEYAHERALGRRVDTTAVHGMMERVLEAAPDLILTRAVLSIGSLLEEEHMPSDEAVRELRQLLANCRNEIAIRYRDQLAPGAPPSDEMYRRGLAPLQRIAELAMADHGRGNPVDPDRLLAHATR